MARFYYFKKLNEFYLDNDNAILGELSKKHEFSLEEQQRNSWISQIKLLK